MKKLKSVTVKEHIFEQNVKIELDNFIFKLQELKAQGVTNFEYTTSFGNTALYFYSYREETDNEYKNRLIQEAEWLKRNTEYEYQQYLKLKEKYGKEIF